MASNPIEVTICRTCLRDNPGEGTFANYETNAEYYRGHFKEGWLKKTARIKYQNCFANCERFYCVQVTQGDQGYLLSQISNSQKQQALIDWVRQCKVRGKMTIPDELKDHVIAPVKATA